jgi:hypothetical protein
MTLAGDSGRGPRKCQLEALGNAGSSAWEARALHGDYRSGSLARRDPDRVAVAETAGERARTVHPDRLRLLSPSRSNAAE